MNDFSVVEWSDEDVPHLLDLTQTTLGTSGAVAKTESFWRWKHQDNPFGRSYGIYALDASSQRIASLRVLLRWQFVAPTGETLHAARAVDTATHPDYQRRGLFTRLTKLAVSDLRADGTRLIFNTPNSRSLPGYLKMGWSLVDKRAIYLRPLRPLRMAQRRLRSVDPQVTSCPDAYFAEGAILPWRVFVEEFGSDVWNLSREWERCRVARGWRTARSDAYYSWRYGRHPNVTYYVYALRSPGIEDSGLAGFAVLRPNVRFGWQEVVLCDIVLAKPSVELGRKLMRGLVRNLRADYVVAHFAPGTVELASIRKNLFVRVPRQGMRFTVRPLDAELTQAISPDAWDLSLGDLEVF